MELGGFDLLAGHDLGQSNTIPEDKIEHDEYVLIWTKLSSVGFQPSSRQSHTAVISNDNESMYIFGGFEISERVNSTICYNIRNSTWSLIECNGNLPKPRCYHVSLLVNNLMVIHGGEVEKNKKSIESNESVIESIDDLWALNIITNEWQQLPCLLSPLPRQGHSITSVTINGEKYLLLFGGYNRENDHYYNSIHICSFDSIMKTFDSCLETKKSRGYGTLPVTWMTLVPKGTGPSPRQLHTSTELIDSLGNSKIVIYGGISKGKTIMNDIYILDIETMTWTEPIYGSNALSRGLSGDGPLQPGLYGHSAISIYSPELQTFNFDQLIIFGGNSSIENNSHGEKNSLYRYDITTGLWNKILIGHQFPPHRYSNSLAIITGWNPPNPFPGYNEIDLEFANKDNDYSATAIIFGGYNSMNILANVLDDNWGLDLRWRKIGVEQFDYNIEQKLKDTLKALYPESPKEIVIPNTSRKVGEVFEIPNRNKPSIMSLNNTIDVLNISDKSNQSTIPITSNILHTQSTPMIQTVNTQEYSEINNYLDIIYTIKKERANTEILLRNEKNENKKINEKNLLLQNELNEINEKYSNLLRQYHNDIKKLTNEINENEKKNEKLVNINNELIDLLSLYGIPNIEDSNNDKDIIP